MIKATHKREFQKLLFRLLYMSTIDRHFISERDK
jgi:hypothetical protein